jgi:fatty acid desaturase
MTHGAKVLPLAPAARRLLYDVISAMFLLSAFDSYRKDHQQHHAYAAGPDDADQQFIAYLGARFDGGLPFLLTLLDPVFHLRFLKARLTAVLLTGQMCRRALGLGAMILWLLFAPFAWLGIVIVLFQAATLLQWSTEHLWGRRPVGMKPADTATAVTYGRLLLPESGFWWKLPVYTLFRMILLSGDLPNHDLHHLGKGPWVDAPYTRTRLMLEGGTPLRQTGGLRAMFRLAFDSAKGGAVPRPPREMNGKQMLGM